MTPTISTSDPSADHGGRRIVVVGATGNLGTSTLRALVDDPRVGDILGIARRVPDWTPARTRWASVDIAREDCEDELVELFRGADAVVHLAWLFQPSHRPAVTWRTNVLGGMRVCRAVAKAGVSTLVYVSSVGAYSPGPKDRFVDESWPTHGWPESHYTREKAYMERCLDLFERRYDWVQVARLRPAFLFKREASAAQRRTFLGPFVPGFVVKAEKVPLVPDLHGLRFQALHTDDCADAIDRIVCGTARGTFNLAADPVVDAESLAQMLGGRVVRVPVRPVRGAMNAAWRTRLLPAGPDLLDAILQLPLLDTSKAREEMGWWPKWSATETVREFLRGLRTGAGLDTAPLVAKLPKGGRLREVSTTSAPMPSPPTAGYTSLEQG